MTLALIITTCAAIFFGLIAIFLAIKEDKKLKKFKTETAEDGKTNEEFMNMMVHELRAPATSIKDSSELLLTNKDQLNDQEKEQFLTMINRQAKGLLEQISSILDAGKFESGTFKLSLKDENIQEIIYEKVKAFEPPAAKKGISVTSHIEGPIPALSIDGLRIGQVVNNLISNALKYTPYGGKISVLAKISGANVEISVSDTGIGIPKEQQANIFAKFYQVKTSDRKEEKVGSGLGLYITKKIIEAHGGTIWVESEVDKGTTFKFTLPISQGVRFDIPKPAAAQYAMPGA